MTQASLIKQKAKELGFTACGIAPVQPADSQAPYLDDWLASGCQAGMKYMENHRDIRLDPEGLVPGARSIICVALNYYPAVRRPATEPYIAYYAYGADYHTIVKDKLRQLWEFIAGTLAAPSGTSPTAPAAPADGAPSPLAPVTRVFTDSAPLLERYWAWKAGLGWIGKNTHLIIPGHGSYFFLGEIVTTWQSDAYDTPLPDRCGTCSRCLEACPTRAIERPHRLNAARCLSYWTIEHRGEIPPAQARLLGNRLYGCDTCQTVCPWNRFARPTTVEAFAPSAAFLSLDKKELFALTLEKCNRIFARSAVKRARYEGLMRTVKHLIENDENDKTDDTFHPNDYETK